MLEKSACSSLDRVTYDRNMAFNLRSKTKDEEKKLEVPAEVAKKHQTSSDFADIQKKFGGGPANAPARPPPPRPVARNASRKDPAPPPPVEGTVQPRKAPLNRGDRDGGSVDGGARIIDNSAAALQQRKSLTFLSAKKTSKTSLDQAMPKKSSSSSLKQAQVSVPAESTIDEEAAPQPAENGDNSSASDDDGVIVEWKDEDSSEFSSIKPSKFGTILRDSDKPESPIGKGSAAPVVRMSTIAATADDSPPQIPRQDSSSTSIGTPTPTAATPVTPLVPPVVHVREVPPVKSTSVC